MGRISPLVRGLLLIGVGALLLAALAWLAVTGLLARTQLNTARAEVATLRTQARSGELDAARATAKSLDHHVSRAHLLTSGPVWALAAHVPGGRPVRTVVAMTDALHTITAAAVPDLLEVTAQLDPGTMRRKDGSIDLTRVAAAAPAVHRATAIVTAARDRVAAQPRSGIAAIDSARTELVTQLDDVGATLRSADAAASVLPDMLGGNGSRQYLIALQNTAEARGTGGLAGAFGVLTVADGKLRFGNFDSDRVLRGVPANVEFGKDYDALWQGAATTTKYTNANLSAHFPYAAAIWAAMWAQHSGVHVDGVIALDPSVLSYLLAVTGPTTLTDGTTVNAGNVVSLTESTAYARFPNDDQRRAFLVEVAHAAMASITTPKADSGALVRALARGVQERRLLVWSAHPTLQQSLEQTPIAGALPITNAPYAGLSIVNDGGNKLDYYLDRSVVWTREGCGQDGAVTATVTLTNNAPAHLPAYVTDRSDVHGPGVKPGDNRLMVSWYATQGAGMQGVTVNGRAAAAHFGTERGHPVFTVDLELPRGATRTVVFRLTEPVVEGAPLTVLDQPLVRPLVFRAEDSACR